MTMITQDLGTRRAIRDATGYADVHESGLTLEQVVTRIRNGEPLHWLTVHDRNGDVYDMAVDITAQPQMAEGDRPPRS
jgi:hypothetical protein